MRPSVAARYTPDTRWREAADLHADSKAFRRRVSESLDVIRQAAKLGTVAVMTSWGKDSVVLADLVLQELGEVDLVHFASPYEMPGYDETIAHFRARARVHIVDDPRSEQAVIEWLREVGLCFERGESGGGQAGKRKRDRGSSWADEHGVTVQMIGLRAEESRHRRINAAGRGLVYERLDGATMAMPIAWWTARDVWAWIVARGLPYNRLIYDAETDGFSRYTLRNTGWLTTVDVGEGRMVWLRRHFPELYRKLIAAFPRLDTYR